MRRSRRLGGLGVVAVLVALAGCASVSGPAVLVGEHDATPFVRDTLHVVSLNVGMLPGFLGHDDAARAERICDRLLGESSPDVIVLLEIFDEDARDVFTRRLAPSYPFVVRHAGGLGPVREDSGLLVASRVPFVTDAEPRIGFAAFDERGPFTRADFLTRGCPGTLLRINFPVSDGYERARAVWES